MIPDLLNAAALPALWCRSEKVRAGRWGLEYMVSTVGRNCNCGLKESHLPPREGRYLAPIAIATSRQLMPPKDFAVPEPRILYCTNFCLNRTNLYAKLLVDLDILCRQYLRALGSIRIHQIAVEGRDDGFEI